MGEDRVAVFEGVQVKAVHTLHPTGVGTPKRLDFASSRLPLFGTSCYDNGRAHYFRKDYRMSWQERICVDPAVCHGKACIRGTRVMVSVVLDNVAAGESVEDIMRGYHLERADVQAAVQYAAELARETVIPFLPGAA